jgi:hypothetical protein
VAPRDGAQLPPPPHVDPRMAWTCLVAAIGTVAFTLVLLAMGKAYFWEVSPCAGMFLVAGGLIRGDAVVQLKKLRKAIK